MSLLSRFLVASNDSAEMGTTSDNIKNAKYTNKNTVLYTQSVTFTCYLK